MCHPSAKTILLPRDNKNVGHVTFIVSVDLLSSKKVESIIMTFSLGTPTHNLRIDTGDGA